MYLKKQLVCTLACALSVTLGWAQSVGINIQNPDPSAVLDVHSLNGGVLIPRMTEVQRDAIVNPANGLMIFNTSSGCVNMFVNGTWKQSCFECGFGTILPSSNSPLCAGQTLTLQAPTIPNATYAWTGPNGFTDNTANPTISNATTANSGNYYLTITANNCTSSPVLVNVNVLNAPALPTIGGNINVCAGDNLQLTTTTVPGATYTWSGPQGFSSSAQNPLLTGVTTANAGTYSLFVTQGGCVSPTNTATVTVANTSNSQVFTSNTDFSNFTLTQTGVSNNSISLSPNINGGNGASGAFNLTSNGTISGGTYQYSSFTISNNATLTVTGNQPLIIRSQGPVVINGTINADGNGHLGGTQGQVGQGPGGGQPPPNNGNNCGNWGAHGGGGSYGTSGTNGGNSATGCSSADIGGQPGSIYGDAAISTLHMGSGGAGNGWCSSCNSGGQLSGGAGGGAVAIYTPSTITINGGITVNGANGNNTSVYASGSSGAGSGGSIVLEATSIQTSGTFTANGGTGGQSSNNSSYNCCGGNGGSGRIRYNAVSFGSVSSSSPAYSQGSVPFLGSGSAVSTTITPTNLCKWGVLAYSATVPTNTSLTVDVLDANGNTLVTGVSSGTDLSTISQVASVNAIRIRVNLSTTVSQSPTVNDITVNWVQF